MFSLGIISPCNQISDSWPSCPRKSYSAHNISVSRTNAWEIWHLMYFNIFNISSKKSQYFLLDMLNKSFIAKIAENTYILHWKKRVKTGISDYLSPGEIKVKISRLFFFFFFFCVCFCFQAKRYLFRRRNESCWE